MNNLFKNILPALLLSSAFASTATIAADTGSHDHSGHSHDHSSHSHHMSEEPKKLGPPIDAEQAAIAAKVRINDLVKTQAINPNWADVEPQPAIITTRKHAPNQEQQWQVSFFNKDIKEPSRQTLYVFLGIDGSFRATNYTGR